jgi:hypothetical protein
MRRRGGLSLRRLLPLLLLLPLLALSIGSWACAGAGPTDTAQTRPGSSVTTQGLQPGAQVYYRVTIDRSAFAGAFRAAPSPDSASTGHDHSTHAAKLTGSTM